MISVEMDREEWDRVLMIIAEKPWSIANPLIMKIGGQIQRQAMMVQSPIKKDGKDGLPVEPDRRPAV